MVGGGRGGVGGGGVGGRVGVVGGVGDEEANVHRISPNFGIVLAEKIASE